MPVKRTWRRSRTGALGFPEQALPAGRLRRPIVEVWWLHAVQVQKEMWQEALDLCANGASRK